MALPASRAGLKCLLTGTSCSDNPHSATTVVSDSGAKTNQRRVGPRLTQNRLAARSTNVTGASPRLVKQGDDVSEIWVEGFNEEAPHLLPAGLDVGA